MTYSTALSLTLPSLNSNHLPSPLFTVSGLLRLLTLVVASLPILATLFVYSFLGSLINNNSQALFSPIISSFFHILGI